LWVSLIRVLTPSIHFRFRFRFHFHFHFLFLLRFVLHFVFLALGDAGWRRPPRLISLRDEWRRIGLPQPAC
jgi:hypothetical protein